MTSVKRTGRLLSLCDCTKGKDLVREEDEIAKCQEKQECYKKFGRFCHRYRIATGHCDYYEKGVSETPENDIVKENYSTINRWLKV